MATHRYWRLTAAPFSNSVGLGIAEIELHTTVGGADVASGGTASASSTFAGSAAQAFDDNPATDWEGLSHTSDWVQYDFGGSPQDITEIAITASVDSNHAPASGTLAYSDDGTNFTTLLTFSGQSGWAAGATRTFATPAPVTTTTATKLLGYAVVGSFPDRTTAAKVVGYAVTGPRPDGISAYKVNAYAVTYDPSTGAPNPFATSQNRWMSCSHRLALA